MILLQGLLWLLLGLLVLAVVVLALPVRLRLAARTEPEPVARVELGLLGGLVPRFAVFDSAWRRDRAPPPDAGVLKPERPKKKRRKGRSGGRMLRAVPRLLRDLLRCVRIEECDVSGRFGLVDPADTGQVYGLIAPLAFGGAWALGENTRISVVPEFRGPCLEGRADILLAVVPLRLVPPVVRFAWHSFGPER